ncbi:MAG: hypothetical protein RI988_1547 [Pseudomonadota bacterium]|jgi:hypothetical protein
MAHTRLYPLLRWVRKPAAVSEPDFGDHGTAFGLDLSLTPAQATPGSEPAPAPALPASPAAPAHGEPSSLWRRVGGRRAWRDS